MWEDNSQCISVVTNGYSPNLRHLARVQRTCIGALHEAFYPTVEEDVLIGEVDEQPFLNCSIAHCPSAEHKGDLFTKPLDRAMFLTAIERIGMRV